jgi:hypothetical protein
MKYLVLIVALTLSGCAGRWFETRSDGTAPAPAAAPGDLKTSTVSYVRDLCGMPREQREAQMRALNEELLPNHAVVSCGRGGAL